MNRLGPNNLLALATRIDLNALLDSVLGCLTLTEGRKHLTCPIEQQGAKNGHGTEASKFRVNDFPSTRMAALNTV